MDQLIIKYNERGISDLEDKLIEYLGKLAEEVKDEAKAICPVDTGKMRDSIDVNDGEDKKEKIVGTDCGYGLFVEMGTVKQDPQPFMRPSLDITIARGFTK